MPFDIFISHSSKDGTIANAVCAALERNGIACWIAPRNIPGGHDWPEEIFAGIEASRAMILLVSAHSNRSKDVLSEVRLARESGRPVIPLFMENVALSRSLRYFIGGVQWLDATSQPIEPHLDSLAKAIGHLFQEVTGEEPVAASAPKSTPPAAAAAAAAQATKPYAPCARFSATASRALRIGTESGATFHVRLATSLELGRQTELSLPFGGFDDARHFTEVQRGAWSRLSRRHLRLSVSTAGLSLCDLREHITRDEHGAFVNGRPWPATVDTVALDAASPSEYEASGGIRLRFTSLPYLDLRTTLAEASATFISQATGVGGCEVRAQWPGGDAPSPHVVLMLWGAVAFTPANVAGDDLFLLGGADAIWLGSSLDAPRLTADSLPIARGELVPLAPGRKIVRPAAAGGAATTDFTMTCAE